MSDSRPGEITRILSSEAGLSRREALERLVPILYDELRVIARSRLAGERPDHSLQTTELVHEAWVKLVGDRNPPWDDRGHFFRAAAEAMRRILIDHARTRTRLKRGGRATPVDLEGAADAPDILEWPDPDELLAVDEALRGLEQIDDRAADVVRLRYFGGLNVAETARALDLSERTVMREWAYAKAWLRDALDTSPSA